MKQITIILLHFLLAFHVNSQSTISGNIVARFVNEKHAAIESATVTLLRIADSSIVKISLSDNKGFIEFENVKLGSYILSISSVGFIKFNSAAITITESNKKINLGDISLLPVTYSLQGVIVESKKPFVEQKIDRIVVNVENSIVSAGSTVMEVLERSPGVNVDQNEVISIRGRSGVVIMIDGKPTAMTGADLTNYLRSLPTSAVERVEIITNPSAKYEAAGNSGIIDIRMKKDKRFGSNGTFTGGYGQGIYPRTNSGLSFNYRNKKINLYGNYNYGYSILLNHLLLDRNFYENGIYNGGDVKDNYNKTPLTSNTGRLGLDFFASKKTIIGLVANENFNHSRRNADNNSDVIDPQHQLTSVFTSLATNNDHSHNLVININVKHAIDSIGKEITTDLDYGVYNSKSITVNSTKYFKLDGTQLQPDYTLDGHQNGVLNFKTAKVDFANPFKKGIKLDAGFKISYVSSDNDAMFFDVSSGIPLNDINKTNHFLYHEIINAGYLNFNKSFKKFELQIGLRGEQTHIRTEQKKDNIKFDSSYFQLFPSAFLTYKIKDDQTVGLSVSRRIDRPGYSQLNPFLFLIDVTTYATGRPGLLPQLTWSYELSYAAKSLNFKLMYSHTINDQNITLAKFKEVFPNMPSADNVTVQVPINLKSSDYIGFTIAAPIHITKWWNIVNNVNFYYQHFNGLFSGTTLSSGKPVADTRTNNTFTLKKGWTAELNANFNSGGRSGFMVFRSQWGISSGIQKIILKTKGTVRFNMTDIFWTNLPKAVVTYNNYVEKWHALRDTRMANLSFTWRFGNNNVQGARRRTTSSEEERKRAGN